MNGARERQHGAVREHRVGNRLLVALSDGHIVMDRRFLGTPTAPTAGHDALQNPQGEAILPIGCFLLLGERLILIDAGFGPHGVSGDSIVGGELPHRLEGLGVGVSDIDEIALTHLHEDHVGWLADADGAPLFPRATVHVGSDDWTYFIDSTPREMPLPGQAEAALRRMQEQGRVVLHDGDAEVAPALTRVAAPGHTPGHAVFLLQDGAERLLLVGDAFYCGQQLTSPHWGAATDADPGEALSTRSRLVNGARMDRTLVLGSHFPGLEAVPPI